MGISVKGGLSLGVSQVRSEDKMAADLQMAALLFYHKECSYLSAQDFCFVLGAGE
jgi:hypothetical protein